MYRATSSLVLVAALTALTSCSQSPSLGGEDEDPSAYSTFPSTSETSRAEGEQLEVVMKRPENEITGSSVITVSFNQAMVEPTVGEVEADEPIFQVEPNVAGTYHWMGSRTAVFHPEEAFPEATHFKVTVPAGTESLSGSALAEDYTFGFHTPLLEVGRVRTTPDWNKLRPKSEILVYLNLEVDQKAFEEAVTLEEDGAPIAAVIEHRDEKSYYGKESYAIKRPGGFRLGSRYQLHLSLIHI